MKQLTLIWVLILTGIILLQSPTIWSQNLDAYKCIEYRDSYDRTNEWIFYKEKEIDNVLKVVEIHAANSYQNLDHRKEFNYNSSNGFLIQEKTFDKKDQPFIDTSYLYNNDNLKYEGKSTIFTKQGSIKIQHVYNNGYYKNRLLYLEWIKYYGNVSNTNILSKVRAVFNKSGQPESIQIYEREVRGNLSSPLILVAKVLVHYKGPTVPTPANNTYLQQINQSMVYDILNKLSGGRGKNYPPIQQASTPNVVPQIDYIIVFNPAGMVNRYIQYRYTNLGTIQNIDTFRGLVKYEDLKSNFRTNFRKTVTEIYYSKLTPDQEKILMKVLRPDIPPTNPNISAPEPKEQIVVTELPKNSDLSNTLLSEFGNDLSILAEPKVEVEAAKPKFDAGWRMNIKGLTNQISYGNRYIVNTTLEQKLVCIDTDIQSGPKILWTYDETPVASNGIVDNDTFVYFTDINGNIYCKKVSNGDEVWKRVRVGYAKSKEQFSMNETYLFLATRDKELIVLNKIDGSIVQVFKDMDVSNIPTSVNKDLWVGLENGEFFPIVQDTWKVEKFSSEAKEEEETDDTPGADEAGASDSEDDDDEKEKGGGGGAFTGKLPEGAKVIGPCYYYANKKMLIFYDNQGYFTFIDPQAGTKIVNEDIAMGNVSSVVLDDKGGLYVGKMNGEIAKLDLTKEGIPDGWMKDKEAKRITFGGYNIALAYYFGKLIIVNNSVEIVIVDAMNGEKLNSYMDSIGETVFTRVFYNNNFIFYGSKEQALVGVPFKL